MCAKGAGGVLSRFGTFYIHSTHENVPLDMLKITAVALFTRFFFVGLCMITRVRFYVFSLLLSTWLLLLLSLGRRWSKSSLGISYRKKIEEIATASALLATRTD